MQALMIMVFLIVFAVIMFAVAIASRFVENQRRKHVSGMLENVDGPKAAPQATVLVSRGQRESSFVRFLSRYNFVRTMEDYLQQAGLDWSLSKLLFLIAVSAAVGALFGFKLRVLDLTSLSATAMACIFAVFPWLYVLRKRSKRMAAFEEQFPEALDFLARAMRAGHAFPVSLEMLSVEAPDPLRSEFKKVFNEQNLGESLIVVLGHLADRVPLIDVRFFVSAVLMQRETGGNLGEILTKLAGVIRERFRLKGQVRAASAHGRMTAGVLSVLPIVTVLGLLLVSPTYPKVLMKEVEGRIMIAAAIVGQIAGYLVMRKIVNIKV